MMDIESKNWTATALMAWAEVVESATSNNHAVANTYHLFYCLWKNRNSSFINFLKSSGIEDDSDRILELVNKFSKKRPDLFHEKNSNKLIETSIKNCVKFATKLGKKHENIYLGIEHFIWGILNSDDQFCDFLLENNIDTEHLKLCIDAFVKGELEDEDEIDFSGIDEDDFDDLESEKSQLSKFCVLLNDVVSQPNFGVISGRDSEIRNLEEILSCKTKSNCVLIGEAGTGKTSVVEGLAQVVSSKKYTGPLKDKKIYSLDVGLLLAGSKYRGQFEQRFSKLLEELKQDKNAIIFIDEVHTIVGAGGKEGSPDLANLLKPALARGEIKCIGATTSTEFKKFFEKDAALSRRFHPILVNEPELPEMKKIASKAVKAYEAYHNLKFPTKTLHQCIDLCDVYLPHKKFIDKAFDVIDRSFAKAKMREAQHVETEDVLAVISELSGVEKDVLTQNLQKQFCDIAKNFKKYIYGQDEAMGKIYDVLACAKVGLNEDGKPLASFLFVGPTSVGKTYTAKKISEEFYGNDKSFLQLNMSEYQEQASISRLIGASAGYVGYEDGGLLTEFVRKNPNSLILFDEVEKCNPSVLNLLLQILDEASIKDNLNRDIDFSRCIVVLTSNIGASTQPTTSIGFLGETSSSSSNYQSAISNYLAPELVARIDETIIFQKLNGESIAKIFDQYSQQLISKINKKGIKINFNIQIQDLCDDFDTLHAREIKNLFRSKVQTPIAHFVSKNAKAKKISVKVIDKKVILE